MTATKEQAVEHHEAAATAFEHAAAAHREAAKHAGSANYEKAERYSQSALDQNQVGTRHATEASLVYSAIHGDKDAADAAAAAEAAAADAKHAAKKAAAEAEAE